MGNERTVMFQLPSFLSGTLAAVQGSVAGRSWELSAGTFVIGRSDDCDLVLGNEAGVSKVHAKIVASGDHYTLVDNESRNGTIVNGVPVQRVRLGDGDEIRICGCLLRFSQRGGAQEVRVRNAEMREAQPETTPPPPPQVSAAGLSSAPTQQAMAAAPLRTATGPQAAVSLDDAPPDGLPPQFSPQTQQDVAAEPSWVPPAAAAPARGRVLGTWYAMGLVGSLILGGGASAVLALSVDETAVVEQDAPVDPVKAAIAAESAAQDAAVLAAASADAGVAAVAAPDAAVAADANADVAAADEAADDEKAGDEKAGDVAQANDDAEPEIEPVAVRKTPRRVARRADSSDRAEPADAAADEPADDEEEGDEPAAAAKGKTFAASAEGPRSEQLRVRGGGRVRSVDAKDGDVVTKGQVLVSFDDSVDQDEIANLKDRIASLQGSEYEGAKRQLAEAEDKLAALLASGKSPPVTAPVAGTVSGLSVSVGDTLKNGALVGNVGEGGKASRLRATVDRGTRVKKGQTAILVFEGGDEATGSVVQVSGRTVVVDTGGIDAATVKSVRF